MSCKLSEGLHLQVARVRDPGRHRRPSDLLSRCSDHCLSCFAWPRRGLKKSWSRHSEQLPRLVWRCLPPDVDCRRPSCSFSKNWIVLDEAYRYPRNEKDVVSCSKLHAGGGPSDWAGGRDYDVKCVHHACAAIRQEALTGRQGS